MSALYTLPVCEKARKVYTPGDVFNISPHHVTLRSEVVNGNTVDSESMCACCREYVLLLYVLIAP